MRWALLCLLFTSCNDPVLYATAPIGLAHPGPWQIPPSTEVVGNTQWVENTQAGAWDNGANCAGQLTQGALILRDFLYDHFPQAYSIGGYSCRPNSANTSMMSVHGSGRALDIMIMTIDPGDEADNDLGDPIGNWLIENAEYIGIQYIIWDQWTWNTSRAAGLKSRAYGGPNPHADHLHIELSLEAAEEGTDWFGGPKDPPHLPQCENIPSDGRTLDQTDRCFQAYGDPRFWRFEEEGYGNSLIWTNAFQSDEPSNWAQWQLYFDAAGTYEVEYHAVPAYAVYNKVRHHVRHANIDAVFEVDQSNADGWISLGTYSFEAGGDQHVSLFDNDPDAVPEDQHVIADALRLVPVSSVDAGVVDAGDQDAGTSTSADAGTAAPTKRSEEGCGCTTLPYVADSNLLSLHRR